jgi:hypothetical protein
MIIGFFVIIAIWACLIAWVAKVAASRGRSVLGWALIGGVAGLAGVLVGLRLLSTVDDTSWAMLAALAPLVLLIAPMTAIAVALMRMPVRTGRRASWKVHSPTRGAGALSFVDGAIELAWKDDRERVALSDLRVKVDGETLRLAWTADGSDVERVVMPMEKPQNRAGRMAQCRALALQLVAKSGR